jgi:TATA-binding protein-associated factor
LEEKIMGLQKFKLQIANTVISQDNSSLETMATDHLFDLFRLDQKSKEEEQSKASGSRSSNEGKVSMKTVLDGLPDIWDTEQYDREYDLTDFIQTLH